MLSVTQKKIIITYFLNSETQTPNSIQPHKVKRVCVNGLILTYRNLHRLWDLKEACCQEEEDDQRSHFQPQMDSLRRVCVGIQMYIRSSHIKCDYYVNMLLSKLLRSGGRIQPVVYILTSSFIKQKRMYAFSLYEPYTGLSVSHKLYQLFS